MSCYFYAVLMRYHIISSTLEQFHRGFLEYIQVWCWWGPCLLHDLPDCTELGGMVLNSTVRGAGWGMYSGVPNATFLAGSLSLSLPCCSSCSLVVSSFPLLFLSSCLANLKGAFKEAGTFLLFPFAALIRSSLQSFDSLCLTSSHKAFQALFLHQRCPPPDLAELSAPRY